MAKVCFPSVIYKCKLHCFDTEDESLGDWYEDDPACAVRVFDPSNIEFKIKRILTDRFNHKATTLSDFNETKQYIIQEIERLKQLEFIIEKYSAAQLSRSNFKNMSMHQKGNKYKSVY
jgi:hypothetical protein